MKKVEHEWGPWEPQYNLYGELLSYANRRCSISGCEGGYQSARIPTVHELSAMTRKELRARL